MKYKKKNNKKRGTVPELLIFSFITFIDKVSYKLLFSIFVDWSNESKGWISDSQK